MEASEALKISKENTIPIDDALAQIKASAESGSTQTVLHNIGPKVINDLMNLGYKVSIGKDNFGVKNWIADWSE